MPCAPRSPRAPAGPTAPCGPCGPAAPGSFESAIASAAIERITASATPLTNATRSVLLIAERYLPADRLRLIEPLHRVVQDCRNHVPAAALNLEQGCALT